MRVRGTCLLLVWTAACSTLGEEGGRPDGLPHGGTGEFRLLDDDEVSISGPPGRAIVLGANAVESAMPVDGHLFYATAPPLDDPPMLPEDHPPGELFWPAFEPRRIHRGVEREEGFGGYARGPEVLSASEAWEGGEVFDPWVVVEAGRARLYYAGAGGVGVAEAPAVDGAFTRVGSGPILADARRPSVIRGVDDAWWMYYQAAGGIEAARSEDGLTFSVRGPITLRGEDDGEGAELRAANPGALRVRTRSERTLVRMYFESVRSGVLDMGEAHLLFVAGSADGLTFERHPLPVIAQTDVRFGAPVAVDDRVTLLYGNAPFFGGPFLTRAVIVSVSPGGQRFAPEE